MDGNLHKVVIMGQVETFWSLVVFVNKVWDFNDIEFTERGSVELNLSKCYVLFGFINN